MPETITSYYSFSAGTKARSSQVNSNFSNYRGTLLPIDPNTSAAADLTYNLGSPEYYFLQAYLRTLNLRGVNSTTGFSIFRASASAGQFPIEIGGSEVMRIGLSVTSWNYGGSTCASIDQSG